MIFEEEAFYHIYTQGNNRKKIFFSRRNYLFFYNKIRKHISPYCDILAYCLMPNHFHILIMANKETLKTKVIGRNKTEKNVLSESIRVMLSSYSQAINKQEGFSGSLFRQNIKFKKLGNDEYIYNMDSNHNDVYACLSYIHQNPLKAYLVKRMEDWEFSSFRDFAGMRDDDLVNKELVYEVTNIDKDNFLDQAYTDLPDDIIDRLL
jgi:REP element-mobilizing transposase RayT